MDGYRKGVSSVVANLKPQNQYGRVRMANRKEGIYLNKGNKRVRRIGIGAIPPEGQEWVQLSDDPNLTLVSIREMAQKQGLASNTEEIVWA